jgi:hypothetical protein
MDPEEMFGAIFGGERFKPLIGELSLARDMKSAMQEADEGGSEGTAAVEGAGASTGGPKKIMSPEEKARKDEKERARQAEVWSHDSPP